MWMIGATGGVGVRATSAGLVAGCGALGGAWTMRNAGTAGGALVGECGTMGGVTDTPGGAQLRIPLAGVTQVTGGISVWFFDVMGLPISLVINIFLGVIEQVGAVSYVSIMREDTGTAATCGSRCLPMP